MSHAEPPAGFDAPRGRREFLRGLGGAAAAGLLAEFAIISGCTRVSPAAGGFEPVRAWGKLGLADGRFQKPRSVAIDARDRVYAVDKTGRVQAFDREGNFLHGWRTPEIANGKPTGLSFDRSGRLMVADTHYFRVLFYEADGTPLPELTIGGTLGAAPGELAFVTDCVQAADGCYFTSEYGQNDRLQKFAPDRRPLGVYGLHGEAAGQFSRPQSIALDEEGLLWVADSCNHRIVVIDWRGDQPRWVRSFGSIGSRPGQFRYPYGILLAADGNLLVAEYGGHRVQKLSREGRPIAAWGTPGRELGQLNAPWSLVQDSQGLIYVVESGNHRIQCWDVG